MRLAESTSIRLRFAKTFPSCSRTQPTAQLLRGSSETETKEPIGASKNLPRPAPFCLILLPMSSALLEESRALLEDLERSLLDAPPEMRPIVEAQIQNMRQSIAMLEKAMPQMEANKQYRPALSPELKQFFRPLPGPEIPTWIQDGLVRAQAGAFLARCPQNARVYEDEDSLVCAIPLGIGMIPRRNGISLGFYKSGQLRSQWYYDNGLLRWAISYHANGGRETFGLFADQEEREHKEHGLHTTMNSAGTIITQANFHVGVRHGWTKIWDEDGYPVGATLYDGGRVVDQVRADGTRQPSQT